MILFIASEVMFFVAWFWAFFDASLFPDEAAQTARMAYTGGAWPPEGIEVLDPLHLPLFNTIILLLSGTTVTWAHHALIHNERGMLKAMLALTVALGILFSYVQFYEYAHAPFDFKDSIYGATFFMATGFHGFHVLVGTIFLIVCLFRAMAGHFTPREALRFRGCCLVLAFRRRGMAVPLLRHLHLGFMGRRNRPHLNPPLQAVKIQREAVHHGPPFALGLLPKT